MDKWRNIDAITLMANHGALNLSGNPNSNTSDINDIANAMDQPQEPEDKSMDGDHDIPEEHRTNLSNFQRSGLPPAQMIDAASDKERMIQQYMGQNGGVIVPDGMSYLDFMNSQKSQQGQGEGKVIVGELKRNHGKIIID